MYNILTQGFGDENLTDERCAGACIVLGKLHGDAQAGRGDAQAGRGDGGRDFMVTLSLERTFDRRAMRGGEYSFLREIYVISFVITLS